MPLLPNEALEGIYERQLIYGGPKVGKSWLYRSIAIAYLEFGNDNYVHVIDNDKTTLRMLAKMPELRDVIVPHVVLAHDLDALPGVTEQILNDVEADDWLVVDMINRPWDFGPQWYRKKVFGEDEISYWAQARMEAEAGDKSKSFGGMESKEWKYVKPAYLGWETTITMSAPCHVMLLAEEGEVVEQYDKSGEEAQKYAIVGGMKPKGEKKLPHRVDTIMRMTKTLGGKGAKKRVLGRELTMIGDREREEDWDEITDGTFTLELDVNDELSYVEKYLMDIALWEERD